MRWTFVLLCASLVGCTESTTSENQMFLGSWSVVEVEYVTEDVRTGAKVKRSEEAAGLMYFGEDNHGFVKNADYILSSSTSDSTAFQWQLDRDAFLIETSGGNIHMLIHDFHDDRFTLEVPFIGNEYTIMYRLAHLERVR